jgi:ribulose-5-phosphate 4-epimerase/fuculose-1-phosphate aldolase
MLAKMVAEKLRSKRGVLLQNHGVVTVGSSLDEAFNLAETIEEIAKIEIISKILKQNLDLT